MNIAEDLVNAWPAYELWLAKLVPLRELYETMSGEEMLDAHHVYTEYEAARFRAVKRGQE